MKKIMMLLCAVCLLIGCTSSQKAVKYQVAKNYFFVNNSPYSGLLKITTEQELGKYFGMAATMGNRLQEAVSHCKNTAGNRHFDPH